MAATALELEDLTRRYGEREALDGVSLSLQAGQTLVVLGPNGAGKTTLLRVLATLLRPHAGGVQVLGSPLPEQSWAVRGRIGLLGHEPLLYRELSARENLRFHARLHGVGFAAGGGAAGGGRPDRARRGAGAHTFPGDGAASGDRTRGAARPGAAAARRATCQPRPGGSRAGRAADRTGPPVRAGPVPAWCAATTRRPTSRAPTSCSACAQADRRCSPTPRRWTPRRSGSCTGERRDGRSSGHANPGGRCDAKRSERADDPYRFGSAGRPGGGPSPAG